MILEDIESIFEYILQYNMENMEKSEASPEVDRIQKLKDNVIDEMFQEAGECPQSIPWEVYMEVVGKVMVQKKSCFRDFNLAGNYFKLAVYVLLNKIYAEECIPDKMRETSLTKIYKKKGSLNDIKNYRFVHGKKWFSKLLEKCLVKIIEDQINMHTPQSQIGGLPGLGCRDHIMTITSLIKSNEMLAKPTIVTLVDIKRCFDQIRLNDVVFDTLMTGADVKAVKVLHDFTKEIKIKIAGDPDEERSGMVRDTVQQGSNFAPKGSALSIGKATQDSIPVENCDKVGEQIVPVSTYVDDAIIPNKDVKAARENGEKISRAIEVLSLTANDKKSVCMVIGGDNEKVKEARKDLQEDKIKLHGRPIEVVDAEPYLGFMLKSGGFKESVKATIKQRSAKAWGRAAEIKTLINHPAIKPFGWMKAGITLVKAIIPPILTYSAEAWVGIPKYVMEGLEQTYKQIIYSVFEIPEKTSYSGVLMELGLTRLKHIVAKMQISYMAKVLWEMQGSIVHEVIMEEWRVFGERSTLAKINNIAKEYGLEDMLMSKPDKIQIKTLVRRRNEMEIFRDCFASTIVMHRNYLRVIDKSPRGWPKIKSQALLAWRTGSLKFRHIWRVYNTKKGLRSDCVMPLCDGPDNWEHLKVCKWYKTRWKDSYTEESEIADYLVAVNKERFDKVKLPLL